MKNQSLGSNLKRFWKEPPSGRFLNLKEILRLGVSSLGVSFIANFISIYITISYVPILYNMGNSGTLHATLMYLAASVLALIFTPLYGKMMQRTKTKLGRYKPYILFLAPVVAILGVFAVWSPDSLTQTQRIIYVYMFCTPTIFLWNLWFNTFNMFPGVFTPNQQERADIWSPIGLVMGFAPTIMNAVRGVVIAWKGDIVAGRIYGVLSAVLGIVCVIALLGVKERVFVTEEEEKKEKVSAIEGLRMIVKNRPLMILTLAICLGSLKNTIDLCWDVLARVKYAADVNTAVALIGGLSLFVGFAATPNMILLPWMTRKFNNRTILLFWQGCNVVGNLVLALIGFQNFPQGSWSPYVITFLRFVSLFNALGSLQPLILSEIGDLQQAKSGYRLEGFIQTFAYSLTAVVAQFAAIIPAIIQSKMEFNPANYQVPPGVEEFVLEEQYITIAENYGNVALWISVVSSALMLICLIFYDLDKRKHAAIVEQLKATAVNADEIAREEGKLHILGDFTDTEEDMSIRNIGEDSDNKQTEQDGEYSSDDNSVSEEKYFDPLEKTDNNNLMKD
ncbi:MAG: MFS transporter [Clostridia bacterium]|nr:MFS transporter [Clostridia bacterium]